MLRLGFFEQFKGKDTVLLCGSREDIAVLRERLAFLGAAGTTDSLAIHELCAVSERYPVELFASSSHFRGTGNLFSYDQAVSEKLAALEQASSGHQYFDLANQRTLMVSVGEYDENFWLNRG